ncbi:YuzD family protein [Virgibacillus halophilus]|uniref:YuzD family protein n=1 Tax=Tigheibacillus halophilus TaxID=361280 RepID=UPI0036308541
MKNNDIIITVYGAQQICASCVGAPGSKDTYEWLQAAIARKFVDDDFQFEYVDIDHPPDNDQKQNFVQKIWDDELLYPVVLVNEEIVAEGVTMLKKVYRALESRGAVMRETEK